MKSYVYIISMDSGKESFVKIGVYSCPKDRLEELQIGNPYKLNIVSSIEMDSRKSAYNLENYLHRSFGRHHVRGEWFRGNHINIKNAMENYPYLFKAPVSHSKRLNWKTLPIDRMIEERADRELDRSLLRRIRIFLP